MLLPAYLFGKIFGVLPVSFNPCTFRHSYNKEISKGRKHGSTEGKMRPYIVGPIFTSINQSLNVNSLYIQT